jgi:plasmid stability protein
MPVSITIRNVPDETKDKLASRAARAGQSLQEYLRSQLIELASKPDPQLLMARVRARTSRLGVAVPAEVILAHRDADRR